MANTILNPDVITKEALRVLHEKLTFVGNINKQYSDDFAKGGAKIGTALRIRKPAQFTVRDGAALAVQDFVESSTTLTVDKQLGVDVEFSSNELTMSLNDFSSDFIEPAMAQLASAVESNVLVPAAGRSVVNVTAANALFKGVLTAQAYLDNLTTPRDSKRCVLLDTMMQVDIVDELKGLFQDSNEIKKQYREGIMGRTAGADFYSSSRIPVTETSPEASFAIVSLGTNSAVLTFTGAGTLKAGTILGLGVDSVHPETKKAFVGQEAFIVVQKDVVAAGAGNEVVEIAETISASGASKNVVSVPTTATALAADVVKSLVFHHDFMTFASADLVLPKGVDMSSRQVFDGISMRLVRAYDASTDAFPCRLDILFGKKVLRPEYCATVLKGY